MLQLRGLGSRRSVTWCQNTGRSPTSSPTRPRSRASWPPAGYAKDSSGIWAKGGQELTIHWMENTGNKRREDMQAEFIPLLAKQGFKVVTDNSDADTMFQKRLPAGDFDMADATSRSRARTRR